jgi:hypothetical protein
MLEQETPTQSQAQLTQTTDLEPGQEKVVGDGEKA